MDKKLRSALYELDDNIIEQNNAIAKARYVNIKVLETLEEFYRPDADANVEHLLFCRLEELITAVRIVDDYIESVATQGEINTETLDKTIKSYTDNPDQA